MNAAVVRRLLIGASLRRSLLRALALSACLVVASRTVAMPLRARGPSMQPTYRDGQLLIVNRLAFMWRPPARGDVIAVTLAGNRAFLVKRIIALPGERVRIEAGEVVIDDVGLDEPYVAHRLAWNEPEVQLGDDEFFVIGDNRGMPARQHDFGRVSRPRIAGRLVF